MRKIIFPKHFKIQNGNNKNIAKQSGVYFGKCSIFEIQMVIVFVLDKIGWEWYKT